MTTSRTPGGGPLPPASEGHRHVLRFPTAEGLGIAMSQAEAVVQALTPGGRPGPAHKLPSPDPAKGNREGEQQIMTEIRYGDREQHSPTVDYRKAEPRGLTGPDRPLGLDPDPGLWPHPSTLTFDQAAQVGRAAGWVREALGVELGTWYGAEGRRLSAEHERLAHNAAHEGRGRILASSDALRRRQKARYHADAWAGLLNVNVAGVREMQDGLGG